MRLDKFLKVSRLIKRRTVANEACDAGKVSVGGRPVKASYDVKIGDVKKSHCLPPLFCCKTYRSDCYRCDTECVYLSAPRMIASTTSGESHSQEYLFSRPKVSPLKNAPLSHQKQGMPVSLNLPKKYSAQ